MPTKVCCVELIEASTHLLSTANAGQRSTSLQGQGQGQGHFYAKPRYVFMQIDSDFCCDLNLMVSGERHDYPYNQNGRKNLLRRHFQKYDLCAYNAHTFFQSDTSM